MFHQTKVWLSKNNHPRTHSFLSLLLIQCFLIILTLIVTTTTTTAYQLHNLSALSPETSSNYNNNISPKPAKILVHPKNVTTLERKSAFLICEAESDPKPAFSWFKDGKSINKKRMPVIKYSKGSVLRIETLKGDRDSGEYECQVENGVGSAIRSQIQVRAINEKDAPPGFPKLFSQPVTSQTLPAGSLATLICQAQGDPQPEYSWLHELIPVELPDPTNRLTLDGGNLNIFNITESDKGEYHCTASNSKGVMTSSASNLFISQEPLLEGVPTDLKYKLTSPTDVTISWSPPENKNNATIIGYQVFFGKLGAPTSIKHDIPNINRLAFNDLSENTEYAFRVHAKSKIGLGGTSETINFTTPKDSPPPPANVRALADSYTSAMVWWDDIAYFSGIIGYRVYYTLYNQTNAQTNINDDLDRWLTKNVTLTNSVIVSNLIENNFYEVRVCAVSVNFSGKLSNSVRFRTLPEEVPYDLKIQDITTHSAKITWKPPLEMIPSKYKITYDAEKIFLDNKGKKQFLPVPARTLTTTKDQQSIIVYDLLPYTKYRVNVTAVPSKEVFRPPATVHITTAMAAPKQMNEPTLIGASASGREFELILPWASEEYGPIGHYYVIVVPAEMPSHDPDSYSTSDLITSSPASHGPYITAKFPKMRMVKNFLLGDNKTYDGFLNRPLNRDQQYHVFVRAVVEHSETLYTSSAMSNLINLSSPKTETQPSQISNESFRKVRFILISALILVLILAFIVTIFYKKQRQALKTNQMNETETRLLSDHMMDRINSAVPIEPDRRNLNYQSRAMLNHPPVPVNELADHIEVLKMNNNLKDEYESIEPGQQFTWEHSYMDYNRPKNRYGNVVAYDHSRVVLSQIAGIPGSDYINANFCDGYNKPNQYIATQGPLPNTVGDFWRMVWGQNSRTIVMMTQLEERGRVKCVQYWPPRDSSVTYHGIVIMGYGVEELAYYNIRTFRLQHNNEIREVRQFQFTAWPDHGVPDHPTPFLMFLRRIKVSNPPNSGAMIVLCSAGVGRTGCFIVIDSMIERLKQEDTIDIYGHVTSLRAQRNYIVQTEDQYMFIHDSVLETTIASNTEIPVSKLTDHLHKLMQVLPNEAGTGLELEYKRLASIRYTGQKFISANLPINKHKNRLMNILPYESTRVCLEPIAGVEGSDYINASFCDGYRQRNAYIATQSPLPDTVEDMWRMLIEHNSGIIVMLTKLKEMGREKCTQYWPAERYGDYGPYRIVLNQEYNATENYILREYKVTDSRSSSYSRIVRQFQYLNWPEQVSYSDK